VDLFWWLPLQWGNEMRVLNCISCGKIFEPIINTKVCPNCIKADENRIDRIKNHLYDYPDASLESVSDILEIDREKIISFIKAGKLEHISHMSIQCENCDATIESGKYCDACIIEMRTSFKSVTSSSSNDVDKPQSKGMFTKRNN